MTTADLEAWDEVGLEPGALPIVVPMNDASPDQIKPSLVAQLRAKETLPEFSEFELISELFHRINRVIPLDQLLVSVSPDTPVVEAIRLMQKRGFSQLPVIEGTELLGVFSYRSLGEPLRNCPLLSSIVTNEIPGRSAGGRISGAVRFCASDGRDEFRFRCNGSR
jgi:hypothetical protein